MLDVVTMNDIWQADIEGSVPILIEVYNPDIVWTDEEKEVYKQDNCYLRLISDDNKVKYNNKVWLPSSFEFTPPDTDGSKIGNASVSISALDPRVRYLLRSIKLPSEMKIVAMYSKRTLVPETGKFIYQFIKTDMASFTMTTASANNTSATFNLSFDRALNQNIPFDVAVQDRVPATRGK